MKKIVFGIATLIGVAYATDSVAYTEFGKASSVGSKLYCNGMGV